MGADTGQTTFVKEQPAHVQQTVNFWLKASEVTNQQYGRCVTARLVASPKNTQWQQAAFADYPVTHVTWEQAATYARWVWWTTPERGRVGTCLSFQRQS